MKKWKDICHIDDIPPNGGCCALYEGQQVALFRVRDSDNDAVYALDNFDPLSGANVMSRGIVGCQEGRMVVASPIYKQRFCLNTGECLGEDVKLKIWPVRVVAERVELADQVQPV